MGSSYERVRQSIDYIKLALYLSTTTQATPIATTPTQQLPALSQAFFARPADVVAPDLIGCLLVKRQPDGELLWATYRRDVLDAEGCASTSA